MRKCTAANIKSHQCCSPPWGIVPQTIINRAQRQRWPWRWLAQPCADKNLKRFVDQLSWTCAHCGWTAVSVIVISLWCWYLLLHGERESDQMMARTYSVAIMHVLLYARHLPPDYKSLLTLKDFLKEQQCRLPRCSGTMLIKVKLRLCI